MNPPLIYNLFQRLVGPIDRWADHARRARKMGFNWLYLNPWHYPGFSGSLYAPKEFRRLNPLYVPAGEDPASLEPLRQYLIEMREIDLPVMMDLVINHTSKDSPLVEEHGDWYLRDANGQVVSPSVTDPDDPSMVTVWGDLAEIDNAGSPDRDRLWAYWRDLVRDSLDLGFAGFRCDAAYMVPAELWRLLIEEARAMEPQVRFFAETLGASTDAVVALKEAGFDYFFNSSKWWDFRESWALEQHDQFGRIAPSISFPETHDTPRLAGETNGDEAVQRQRYAFAAAFSAGVMMPVGYEYGFRKQVNVVETMPSDWERKRFDLKAFVTRVNTLKLRTPLLQGEGALSVRNGLEGPVLILERRSREGDESGFIVVNVDVAGEQQVDLEGSVGDPSRLRLLRICHDDAPEEGEPVPGRFSLSRAEVVYLLPH